MQYIHSKCFLLEIVSLLSDLQTMCANYNDVMKRKPRRAVNFDWDFYNVAENGPLQREAIRNERKLFNRMLEKLKFKIYPESKEIVTRNLSKNRFIEELKKCKYEYDLAFF
jgi:hypothetical protein